MFLAVDSVFTSVWIAWIVIMKVGFPYSALNFLTSGVTSMFLNPCGV